MVSSDTLKETTFIDPDTKTEIKVTMTVKDIIYLKLLEGIRDSLVRRR